MGPGTLMEEQRGHPLHRGTLMPWGGGGGRRRPRGVLLPGQGKNVHPGQDFTCSVPTRVSP